MALGRGHYVFLRSDRDLGRRRATYHAGEEPATLRLMHRGCRNTLCDRSSVVRFLGSETHCRLARSALLPTRLEPGEGYNAAGSGAMSRKATDAVRA